MAEGGSLPILPGVAGLERALTRRDPARIVSALAQWELRHVWAHKVACAILEEENRAMALDARDLAWLGSLLVERLLHQQDYSAARQALETYFTSPQAKLHDLMKHEPEAALKHVQTFARLYEQHLGKVDAAREHTRRTGEKRKVAWPPKRFKHLVEPEEELLVKMTVDWAACEYRQLRRIDAICLKCRPFISGVIWPAPVPAAAAVAAVPAPQAGPSRTRSQSQSQGNSQDSLPTPDPSSDGVEIISAPTPRRHKTVQQVESAPPQNSRKHERSPSADELVVTEAPDVKRLKMDDGSHPERQKIDPKPLPLRAVPIEAAQVVLQPEREGPATSSPAPVRPRFRDSSVQTSPPPEEPLAKTRSPAPKPPVAAAFERPSPRPRTRSPPPARPAAPPLVTLARTMASSSYVDQGLPPSRVDSRQIFSLLRAGAAEQQQRLERERRHASSDWNLPNVTSAGRAATPPVQPGASASVDSPAVIAESSSARSAAVAVTLEPRGGFRNDLDDASAMGCHVPGAESAKKATKLATPLGPTSSAILMPPPPPTAASRESPIKGEGHSRFRALPSQALVPATADPEAGVAPVVSVETVVDATPTSRAGHSATSVSQDPSTQSSDSIVRDSQEQASTQSSGKEGDASFPSAAQVHRDRSTSVIFPQPGFTGTTTTVKVAEDGDVTMDPSAAAQTVVVGTPDSMPSAPGGQFRLPPSSDRVDSTLEVFCMGSSGRSASTDVIASPQATRPTAVVDESASGETAFDLASFASPTRHIQRECSAPPLEHRSGRSVSGRARASSFPLEASQDPPKITIKERSQPHVEEPAVAEPAATETDGDVSEDDHDDLDSALPTSLSVEELEQQFDAMEESQESSQKASLPSLEMGVAGEVADAVSSSGSGNTRDIPKEVTSGPKKAPEEEDAIAAATEAEQAEALRLKARVDMEAAERRRIAEETAGEGELVDDEFDELSSEENAADVGASPDGDLAAPTGEPFSQAALLTQAIDEPGSLEASDQDGAVLTRRRSFANLEDEAELSEHEQDEVNKVLNEDMWGYLDLLKRDV